MTEYFNDAIIWAQEYGDVLGVVGTIFALTTILLTNGRLIMSRVKHDPDQLAESADINFNIRTAGTANVPALIISPEFGGKKAFAVLPPKELGDFDDHFADGLAHDLVADLQKSQFATPELDIVAALTKKGFGAQKITHELGLNYVISTSIRRQDDRFRITAQLIDHTGAVIWSDKYNTTGDDHMAIQESIAAKIVKQVGITIDPNKEAEQAYYSTQTEAIAISRSPKSRLVAFLLCVFPLTGILGIHRYYVGRPFTGLLYTFTAGCLAIGWIIDIFVTLFGVLADGKGRAVQQWFPQIPAQKS